MNKKLEGTKTHQNLKDAFAGESQANRRYLYFAKIADVEGRPTSPGCSRTRRTARPATRTATSTT
jgi:rubrerythrin